MGMLHACVMMVLGYSIFERNFIAQDGYTSDIFLTGMLVFTGTVVLNNLKIIIISKTLYGFTIAAVILSILAFPLTLWVFS